MDAAVSGAFRPIPIAYYKARKLTSAIHSALRTHSTVMLWVDTKPDAWTVWIQSLRDEGDYFTNPGLLWNPNTTLPCRPGRIGHYYRLTAYYVASSDFIWRGTFTIEERECVRIEWYVVDKVLPDHWVCSQEYVIVWDREGISLR